MRCTIRNETTRRMAIIPNTYTQRGVLPPSPFESWGKPAMRGVARVTTVSLRANHLGLIVVTGAGLRVPRAPVHSDLLSSS